MAAIDLDTQAALERLITVAQGSTGQSRDVADLLLAWHNAGENGGFGFTSFWNLDDALVAGPLQRDAITARDLAFLSTRETEQLFSVRKFDAVLPAVRGDDGALDLQVDGTCWAKRAMRNAAGGCES